MKTKKTLLMAAMLLLCAGLWACEETPLTPGDEPNNPDNPGGSTQVEWVDLGLPSGMLWASHNVGATTPEGYGNYYAWGETTPKSYYDWNTYRFGEYGAFTKYCTNTWGLNGFYDNKMTLEPDDDPATVNMGGGARTPTSAEWEELLANTTNIWTTQNGVHGVKFTASNGKSIFLPAAGYHRFGDLIGDDGGGFYWSSSIYAADNPAFAWIYFFAGDDRHMEGGSREYGYPVRAVRGTGGTASQGGFDANGASNALFSVSATKKIHFSRGNLQYKASTGTWRFAESQLDFVGDANAAISATNSGWIDLFAYGTSGWNSGVNAYMPYSASWDFQDYLRNVDLTGNYAEADWGWHNAISNGGNQTHMWRTMTAAEWQYLLGRSGKWGLATIGGNTRGMIILPDNWVTPSGLTWTAGNSTYGYYDDNTYTASQWQQMEDAGAIFLPAAGDREGDDNISNVGWRGNYWSASHDSETEDISLRGVFFYDGAVFCPAGDSPRVGYSVRLIKD